MSNDQPRTIKWIAEHQDGKGHEVRGHWRRQKPKLTAEQRLDQQRQALVEQAKAEQRDEGLL